MLTAGRVSNASNSDSHSRADICTRTHKHTVSRPDVDPHAGTYTKSDKFANCLSNADFGAVGHGYTGPDSHTDTYEYTYTVSNSNQYSDTGGYGDTYGDKYTVTDAGTHRYECPNSHINTRDIGDIVAYTRPHGYPSAHKLAYAYTDNTTHDCPDHHGHTDARSYRDPHT